MWHTQLFTVAQSPPSDLLGLWRNSEHAATNAVYLIVNGAAQRAASYQQVARAAESADSIAGIQQACELLGVPTVLRVLTPSQLKACPLPCLLHLDAVGTAMPVQLCAVVEVIENQDMFQIIECASANITYMRSEELIDRWSGAAVFLRDNSIAGLSWTTVLWMAIFLSLAVHMHQKKI